MTEQTQTQTTQAQPIHQGSVHDDRGKEAPITGATGAVQPTQPVTQLDQPEQVILSQEEAQQVQNLIQHARSLEIQNNQYKALVADLQSKGVANPEQKAQEIQQKTQEIQQGVDGGLLTKAEAKDLFKQVAKETFTETFSEIKTQSEDERFVNNVNQTLLTNYDFAGDANILIPQIHNLAGMYMYNAKQAGYTITPEIKNEAYRLATVGKIFPKPTQTQTQQTTTSTPTNQNTKATVTGGYKGMPDGNTQVMQTQTGQDAYALKRAEVEQLREKVSKSHLEADRRAWYEARQELRASEKSSKGI